MQKQETLPNIANSLRSLRMELQSCRAGHEWVIKAKEEKK